MGWFCADFRIIAEHLVHLGRIDAGGDDKGKDQQTRSHARNMKRAHVSHKWNQHRSEKIARTLLNPSLRLADLK